jgi:hypothetical protein
MLYNSFNTMTSVYSGFELDHQRTVLQRIQDDSTQFIVDSAQEICRTKQEAFIISASDQLIGRSSDIFSVYKSSAFIAGATAVLLTFQESDQSQDVIRHVLSTLAVQNRSSIVLGDRNTQEVRNVVCREANKGLKTHPEVKEHLEYIAHHFVSITQDHEYKSFVYTGAGFYANRLDSGYDTVMDSRVSKWLGEEIKSINWEELLGDS